LREVEILGEVAELRGVLAYVGSGIGTAVCCRVEAGAAKEVVFDELQERVVAEGLVIDETLLRVGGDDDGRDTQPVAVLIDGGRDDMVVEAAPIVP
jgi:hypothetical protein